MEDAKELYYMYEAYKEKVKELMKEKAEIDEALLKIRIALDAVRELKGREKGAKLYFPVGGSVFVPAELSSTKVLVGIGKDVAIPMEPEEAEKILLERMRRADRMSREYNQAIIDLRKEMDKIADEIIAREKS